MLTATRAATLKHAATYFGSDLRSSNEPVKPVAAPADGEWHLEHEDGRRVIFKLAGDKATLTYLQHRAFRKKHDMDREQARETYANLVKAGYRKW